MNICLLSSTYFPFIGGLEFVVHNLATALSNLGHSVYIVTPYPYFRKVIDDNYNYKVIRFGFRGCGKLRMTPAAAVAKLAYVSKKYHIEIINVQNVFRAGSWSYYFSLFTKSIPIIGTPHGDDIQITPEINDGRRLNARFDKIIRRNLSVFDRITAISPSIRSDLYGLVRNKNIIYDVPNGIWVESYQKNADVIAVRKRFGIPLNSTVIISIGRNHPRKGFNVGLDAIVKLKNEGFFITYLLVGRDMEPIIERSKKLSVFDCLITPGQVDTSVIAELLRSSDIYLSPSIVESFGLATLEAMSAGLPCVVTDVPGSRDLVSPHIGILANPNNPENISLALKFLIENPSIAKAMGEKARSKAASYDWTNIANQYLHVYNRALHSN